MKQIVYVDMDNVLCDFNGMFARMKQAYPDVAYPQSQVDFFRSLKPIKDFGLINDLCEKYDVYILTAPSVLNPMSYTEKMLWVRDNLGQPWVERLIICKHKHLCRGDFLIDDMAEGCGQDKFEGKLIQFGKKYFLDWKAVIKFLMGR